MICAHSLGNDTLARPLTIGLVNNAKKGVLRATVRQFHELLSAAARDLAVELKVVSLNAGGHSAADESDVDDLPTTALDGLIVTGMEPRAASLPSEPLWPLLTELIEWTERNAIPTIWSCLAAHAAVLHLDGIQRQALPTKISGLFDCELVVHGHPLTDGLPSNWRCPQSRRNGLREEELLRHGYTILSRSAVAGVDMFARIDRTVSLFWQGHPEYAPDTLLSEYLRDARRYVEGRYNEFPAVPSGYIDPESERRFADLRDAALDRRPGVLSAMLAVAADVRFVTAWSDVAVKLCSAWLRQAANQAVLSSGYAHTAFNGSQLTKFAREALG